MSFAIILATILGPILAVQAQKWIERSREARHRKLWVFTRLMSTRQARLSTDHVEALNLIDITFYGRGPKLRSNKDQAVLDKWKEYHHHLGSKPEDTALNVWVERGDETFTDLLGVMAIAVGFKFDRVQLRSGSYAPIAFSNREERQEKLVESTIRVLSGEAPLRMDVVGFPVDPEAAEAHKEVLIKLGKSIDENGLRVNSSDG